MKLFTAAEKDIQESASRRDKLNEQAAQLRTQAERLQTDQLFDKDRYAIQSLVDHIDWLRQIEEQIRNAEDRSSELRRELNHQMTQLGSDWSLERPNSIDTSPAAHHQLLEAARRYQDALQRRGKLRRWLRSMTKRSQKELVELIAQLDVVGIPVPDAIDREQARLKELLEMTAGNLSTHARKLEDAGYVAVEKTHRGRIPVTYLALTTTGRRAFEDYTAQLRTLLGGASQT